MIMSPAAQVPQAAPSRSGNSDLLQQIP